MILDGQIVGRPLISYKDTKAAIEALTGVVAGMTAYATDTSLTGYYTGASWVWGVGSSGSTILALPQYHFFVGGSSGSAEDAGTGITYNPATNRLSLDNVQWDLTPTPVAPAEGLMYWNADDGTLNLGMPGGNVNLQLGQEMLLRAKNETGSPITNGQLVYISGGTGSNAIVSLAQANSELSSAATIGMATETIADNQFGYITLSGMVRDINTSGSAAGTVLYLSPTVAGAYTGNKPVAPNHLVSIGVIIRSHATEGVVFVRVDNGFEISELHDVYINSVSDGQILQYINSNSRWENKSVLGDASLSSSGSLVLATVNGNVGSFTNASITVNAKGLITAASSGTAPITGSGTPGRVAQWATSSTLGDSNLIGSGAGVLTLSAAGTYTLTVPATGTAALGAGTLTVSTTNNATSATHTHAITSTSNATSASILASDASGFLQLSGLGIGVAPTATLPFRISKSFASATTATASTILSNLTNTPSSATGIAQSLESRVTATAGSVTNLYGQKITLRLQSSSIMPQNMYGSYTEILDLGATAGGGSNNVYGSYINLSFGGNGLVNASTYGMRFVSDVLNQNTVGVFGVEGLAQVENTTPLQVGVLGTISNVAGTVTDARAVMAQFFTPAGTGTNTNAALFYGKSVNAYGQNMYGLYLESITGGASSNYAIYTNSGLNRLGDQLSVVGSADRSQLVVTGFTTQTATVAQITRNDGSTATADAVLTLGHNSTGTAAALFGLKTVYELESSTTASQTAGYDERLWTDATHASRTVLYRGTTTGNATQTGFYGAWAHNAVSNTAITIIPNGTGDVASVGTFLFTAKDNTSGTTNGGIVVVNPGGGSISLLSDGTDTLQVTCAADGSLSIARSAGTHTFSVSLWGTWQ